MNLYPSIAYWPVACDLSTLTLGHTTVGRETQIACDAVVEHAKRFEISTYTILPAAGISPDQNYAEQPMCEIMCSYLREQGVLVENLTPLIGSTFSTQGEAQAVALYIKRNPNIKRILIVVKWWHALRCYAWLYLYLKKLHIDNRVAVEILPLQSEVSVSDILREFWKANPFNLARMLKVRYFG